MSITNSLNLAYFLQNGCPFCNSRKFSITANKDIECDNPKCPSYKNNIFSKTLKERRTLVSKLIGLRRDILQHEIYIKNEKRACTLYLAKAQEVNLLIKNIKNIRLFDAEGKPIYSAANPKIYINQWGDNIEMYRNHEIEIPDFKIYSVHSKRHAIKILSRWKGYWLLLGLGSQEKLRSKRQKMKELREQARRICQGWE